MWPTYAAKAIGLFFLTAAVLCLLGGLVQINPIWIYGPFNTAEVSSASQPDWYMGWLDGALRIMPGWEIRAFGYEIPNPFFPGVLLAGVTFALLYAWPFLEARVTGDYAEHHIADRPRQRPGAHRARRRLPGLLHRAVPRCGGRRAVDRRSGCRSTPSSGRSGSCVFVLPVVSGWVTYQLCKELSARDGVPIASKVDIREIPGRLFRRHHHGDSDPTAASRRPPTDADRRATTTLSRVGATRSRSRTGRAA